MTPPLLSASLPTASPVVFADLSSQVPAAALSLVAALVFVAGLALQQKGNLAAMRSVPPGSSALASLLATVRQPLWLLGFGCAGFLGFLLMAVAFRLGSLTVVQVLQVTQMIFTIPFSAWVARARIEPGEWRSAVVLTVGLAVFIGVLQPAEGAAEGDPARWLVMVPVLVGLAVALFVAGRARAPLAAAFFGASAGILFALQGACTKEAVALLGEGFTVGDFLAEPAVWGAVLFVPAAVLIQNLALRAGRLASAQTTLVTVSPVTATILGITVYGETVNGSPVAVAVACAGAVACGWAVADLARSPSILAAASLGEGGASADDPPAG